MKDEKLSVVSVQNASLAKRSDYSSVLEDIIRKGDCPFCEEHLFKHHPNPLLFKTEHWLVTDNAWPYEGAAHQLLLISLEHVESATELSAEAFADLGKAFKKVCEDRDISGTTLVMRSGNMAYTGATVRHLHAQIIVGCERTEDSVPLTAVVGFKKPLKP
jgi:diadenosine tetraphosphate (Ap4A) HIT family hydrolase